MTLITDLKSMRMEAAIPEGAVFLLGHFDGVHRGHRALLDEARRMSDRLFSETGTRPAVAVWTLRGMDRGGALTVQDEKLRLFSALGADYACSADFSDVRTLDGEEFFRSRLAEAFRPAGVVCGYNFTFGRGASSKAADLCRMARDAGIACSVVPPFTVDGREVCSTEIRQLVAEGRMEEAARLMGRPYFVTGTVVRGRRLGRSIGWPTMNLRLRTEKVSPPRGVYASVTRFRLPGNEGYTLSAGVSNLGSRPTVNAESEDVTLETHLFSEPGDLYGTEATVSLISYLRPEIRFSSLEELKDAIGRDAENARSILDSSMKDYEDEFTF